MIALLKKLQDKKIVRVRLAGADEQNLAVKSMKDLTSLQLHNLAHLQQLNGL